MARNLMGLYRDLGVAEQLVRDLRGAGIPHDHISIISEEAAGRSGASRMGLTPLPTDHSLLVSGPLRQALGRGGPGGRTHDVTQALVSTGVSERESHLFHEGISRGGALVAVEVRGDDPSRIVDLMERHDPVDLEAASNRWRSEGWKETSQRGRFDEARAERERSLWDRERGHGVGGKGVRRDEKSRKVEIVEEEVDIGKRGVVRGGVRVHTHPVTEEVEEDVRLREEHVDVSRRRVDRPLDEAERERAFRDETVEMVERGEEPVVRKEARVKEEIHVGKEATERTEHISEKVRHTEVEVERLSAEEFGRYEPRFREHFGNRFRGERFEHYRPGYELGVILAREERSKGRMRDWEEIEPLARKRWQEGRHGQTVPFERARDSIAFGYDEASTTKV